MASSLPPSSKLWRETATLRFFSAPHPPISIRDWSSVTAVAPNGTGSFTFTVDDANPFFSYAGMLLPSNDWFIGNDTSYDASALLNAVAGTQRSFDVNIVWDAGKEIQDFDYAKGYPIFEIAKNWGGPDPGPLDQENIVISQVNGPNPYGPYNNIPPGYDVTLLDFTQGGGKVATFTLTVIPEVSTSLLGAFGALLLLRRRR